MHFYLSHFGGIDVAVQLWLVGEQAKSASAGYCLDAVIYSQLLEDMGHVTFDGIQGNH